MIGNMAIQLIKEFCKQYPDIGLELHDGRSLTLREKLLKGEVDVILVSGRNSDLDNVESMVLQQSEYTFCVGKDHSLSREKTVSMAHVALEPLSVINGSFYVWNCVEERFKESGYTPRIAWRTNQMSTNIQLIKSNMASGFLFREVAESTPGIVPLSLSPPLMIDIELVWMKNGMTYPAVKSFISFAREYMSTNRLNIAD